MVKILTGICDVFVIFIIELVSNYTASLCIQRVIWSIEIRRMSPTFEDFRHTEAGDFSINFFSYRSTTSQRGLRALAGCWAISKELNWEVTCFSLPQIFKFWRLAPDFDEADHISVELKMLGYVVKCPHCKSIPSLGLCLYCSIHVINGQVLV